MTRETIPRFDLYAELEVSPSATVEVIEAAYRKLAKQHHPDVASTADADRIKRLNAAREWLTNPDRRHRYDRSRGHVPAVRESVRAESSVRSTRGRHRSRTGARSTRKADEPRATTAPPEPTEPATFGVNSDRVRQFLADLRAFDEPRALQLRAGRFSVVHPDYPAARARMLELGRRHLPAETDLAREAAAVIVRGKVTDPSLAEEIATVASDIAGAIVLLDLLPRDDFELLLAPWTWRGGRIASLSGPPSGSTKRARRSSGASTKRAKPKATGDETKREEASPRTLPPEPARPDADWPEVDLHAKAPATDEPTARPAIQPGRPSRPAAAAPRRRRSNPSPVVLAGAGLAAIVVIAVVGVLVLGNRGPGAVADAGSPTPGPTTSVGAETDAPSPGASPTATTSPPAISPSPSIDPNIDLELERGATQALDELVAAVAAGDLSAVRQLTGGTAPGVRRSGLAATTFPNATTSGISVIADGDGWLATVGDDILRSADGTTWIFDYGDRPLAVFTGTPEHDLFWLEPRHDLFLRVVDATVTRAEVRIRFEWNYIASDTAFLDPARLWLSSLTIGNRTVEVGPDLDVGLAEGAVTFVLTGTFRGASSLSLVAAVTPPTRFTNQSAFELTTR